MKFESDLYLDSYRLRLDVDNTIISYDLTLSITKLFCLIGIILVSSLEIKIK